MTIPLSFQCKTCREFFEWTEEFRRPTNGAPICSGCLAAWFAKKASKRVGTKKLREKAIARSDEKKRLSWEKAEARRAAEKAAKQKKEP